MIQEGVKGITFEHTKNCIVIKRDGEVLTEIPKLNGRNSIALKIYNMQQSIQQLSIFDALEILGLELNNVEIYILSLKLIIIGKTINDYRNEQYENKVKSNHIKAENPY